MQRDYKIGLVSGSVLAIVALVWVATRPSLGPEAGMLRSSQATPHNPAAGLEDRGPTRTDADVVSPATRPPLSSIIGSSSEQDGKPQAKDNATPTRNPQPAGVPDLTIYEQAEKIKTIRFHIVRREDTLSAISRQYYGTPNQWQKILQGNKGAIKDPNKLQPGTKLIIPD